MSIIVNIRGPSGAGKTTLVRRLMAVHGPALPIASPGCDRHEGYQVGPDLQVVGDYRGNAPGLDHRSDGPTIDRLVREYARYGSVVFESLFIVEQVTRWRQLALDLGNVMFAFLGPPVEVCVERRRDRRAARGKLRIDGFNLERMRATWRRLPRHFGVFEAAGARCVWLPWEDPLPALEALLWPAGVPALITSS